MNLRYRLWREKVVPYFDKYDLDDYELIRTMENIGTYTIDPKAETEFPTVKRYQFNGSLIFTGDDCATLREYEQDDRSLVITIEKPCLQDVTWSEDQQSQWTVIWKGFLYWPDFKVDEDQCKLEVKPVVLDEYSPVMDILQDERNVLFATSYDVETDIYPYDIETVNRYWNGVGSAPTLPPTWESIGDQYYLTKLIVFPETGIPEGGSTALWYYQKVYKREVTYNNSGVVPPSGTNWADPEEMDAGIWKWKRPIYNLSEPPAITYTPQWVGDLYTYSLDVSPTTNSFDFNNCRRLREVIQLFTQPLGLSFTSEITSNSPPSGFPTIYNTMIQHISEVGDKSDPATRGLMTFLDLLIWIRDTFQFYWYIDDGVFYLEHISYFEKNLSYTDLKTVEIDFTSSEYYPFAKSKNKYEFDPSFKFRYEQWDFPFSDNQNFIAEKVIKYPDRSIQGNETFKRSPGWSVDLVSIYEERSSLPSDGWVLLDVEEDGGTYTVRGGSGYYDGKYVINNLFSPIYLVIYYWQHNRERAFGYLGGEGGVPDYFESVRKIQIQEEIYFPDCCLDTDLNGLFRTELGDGEFESGSWDPDTGMMTIKLKY